MAKKVATKTEKASAKTAKPTKKAEKADKVSAKSVAKDEVEAVAEATPKTEKAAEAATAKPVKAAKSSKSAAAKASSADMGEDQKKWSELKEKHGHSKAVNYNLSGQFEAQSPLMHKVLGWGFILSNQNDRLEVLFETGRKTLISNYKTAK